MSKFVICDSEGLTHWGIKNMRWGYTKGKPNGGRTAGKLAFEAKMKQKKNKDPFSAVSSVALGGLDFVKKKGDDTWEKILDANGIEWTDDDRSELDLAYEEGVEFIKKALPKICSDVFLHPIRTAVNAVKTYKAMIEDYKKTSKEIDDFAKEVDKGVRKYNLQYNPKPEAQKTLETLTKTAKKQEKALKRNPQTWVVKALDVFKKK